MFLIIFLIILIVYSKANTDTDLEYEVIEFGLNTDLEYDVIEL